MINISETLALVSKARSGQGDPVELILQLSDAVEELISDHVMNSFDAPAELTEIECDSAVENEFISRVEGAKPIELVNFYNKEHMLGLTPGTRVIITTCLIKVLNKKGASKVIPDLWKNILSSNGVLK